MDLNEVLSAISSQGDELIPQFDAALELLANEVERQGGALFFYEWQGIEQLHEHVMEMAQSGGIDSQTFRRFSEVEAQRASEGVLIGLMMAHVKIDPITPESDQG
jgi:hypothetical protein